MGRISQGFKRVGTGVSNSDELLGRMRKRYPNLSELLGGEMDKTGKWVISPGKLSVWIEEGRIKYCLKPGEGTALAFGSCTTDEDTLDAVEASIERGDLEWRKAKPGYGR